MNHFFELLLQIVVNGLALGSVYALFSLGYSIVYSLLGIIHLSHGALLSLGAYVAWSVVTGKWGGGLLLPEPLVHRPLPALWGFLAGICICAGLSFLFDQFCFQRLRARKAPPLLGLVASLGASFVIINFILLFYGAEAKSYPSEFLGFVPLSIQWAGVGVRGIQLLLFAVNALLLGVLGYFYFSRGLGPLLRGIAEDGNTARLLGVPVNRIISLVFVVSGAVAGLSGILLAASFSLSGPYFGMAFGLKGLAVIVLGGLGSLQGTVIAGFLVGIGEAVFPENLSGYKDAVVFLVLIIVLVFRPQGILGKKIVVKV